MKSDLERSLPWLRLAIVLAGVLPLAFFGAVAWLGYVDSVEGAGGRLEALTRAVEEHAERAMERNDLAIQQMARLLKDDDDAGLRAREAQLHEVTVALLLRLPHIRSLAVWSPEGRLLVSSLSFRCPDRSRLRTGNISAGPMPAPAARCPRASTRPERAS